MVGVLPGEHAAAWRLFGSYLSLFLETSDDECINEYSRSPAPCRASVFIVAIIIIIEYSY